jgi:hypothetical protein
MKHILVLILSMNIACNRATADNVEVVKKKDYGDSIQVGELAYGGTGCPEGSIVFSGDPENNTLNLLFDKYTAVAGAGEGRLARRSCNLIIPVSVPAGFQIGIVSAAYKGYVSLPRGAEAKLKTEYFIAGSEGALSEDFFSGDISEELNVLHESPEGAIIYSQCGGESHIRINTSILVETNQAQQEAILTLDQASLIQLVMRACPN